jgi:hypothetical protein
MMRSGYLVGIVASALLLSVAGAVSWLGSKRDALAERESLAQSTADDVRTVLSLRSQRDRASLEPQADANLTKLVRSAMREAGVAESAFVSLSPEGSGTPLASAADSGPKYLIRRSSVRLRQLRLDEIGRVLDRWRGSQPLYAVTSVDLTRVGQRGLGDAGKPSDAEERFDVTLVLTTYVVARENGAASRDAGPRPRKDGPT